MKESTKKRSTLLALACGLGLLPLVTSSGCQSVYGGQLLPSGYYLTDDVQYFAPGTEFKLSREAAAMKEATAEEVGVGP